VYWVSGKDDICVKEFCTLKLIFMVCYVFIARVLKCMFPYELIYQLDAIEYLLAYFQLDMFWAYTPVFRSKRCYSFFTYAAYIKKL